MAVAKQSNRKKKEKFSTLSVEEEFERMIREDKVRDDKRRKLGLPLDGTERIFLAEERCADGDDSSEFVIAILTNEETESAAYERAERIAEKYDARIRAFHDGVGYYRVVRE